MNTKFCYIIVKEGVYRHEIMGVYGKQNLAENLACNLIQVEPDNYHTFVVYKCAMNQPIQDGVKVFEVRRKPVKNVPYWEHGAPYDLDVQRY